MIYFHYKNTTNFSVQVSEKRKSCDRTINSADKMLIDLCMIYSLYILNGRCGSDSGVGDYTYVTNTGCNVIDYGICSGKLVHCIGDFIIGERSKSQHFQIVTFLKMPSSIQQFQDDIEHDNTNVAKLKKTKYRINPNTKQEFQEATHVIFSPELIQRLCIDTII